MEVASATSQTQTASQSATSQLNTDLDAFLLLLTAQITNQDPLEPMDSTTFVSQLAQLTQVEQSIQTNQSLEGIGHQLSSFTELADVQLIGRDVLVATQNLDLNFGNATVQYELAENAQQVSINILDANGSVIKQISGLPTDGGTRHTVNWDGTDVGGGQLPDGVYRFEVISLNSELNRTSYSSYATTSVEELSFDNGQPRLVLRNTDEVSSSAVLAVR